MTSDKEVHKDNAVVILVVNRICQLILVIIAVAMGYLFINGGDAGTAFISISAWLAAIVAGRYT